MRSLLSHRGNDGSGDWAVAAAAQLVVRAARNGERIGHYELGEFIGAGGMGEVYRARDTKLGRDVAIKLLPCRLLPTASGCRGSRVRRTYWRDSIIRTLRRSTVWKMVR